MVDDPVVVAPASEKYRCRHPEILSQNESVGLADTSSPGQNVADGRRRNPGGFGDTSRLDSLRIEEVLQNISRITFGRRIVTRFIAFDERRENLDQLASGRAGVGLHDPLELRHGASIIGGRVNRPRGELHQQVAVFGGRAHALSSGGVQSLHHLFLSYAEWVRKCFTSNVPSVHRLAYVTRQMRRKSFLQTLKTRHCPTSSAS